jgi:hypothetical protein
VATEGDTWRLADNDTMLQLFIAMQAGCLTAL